MLLFATCNYSGFIGEPPSEFTLKRQNFTHIRTMVADYDSLESAYKAFREAYLSYRQPGDIISVSSSIDYLFMDGLLDEGLLAT